MTNKNFIFSVLLIFTTLMLVGYQTNNFVKVWGKYSATEDRMVSVTSDGKVNINGSVSVSGATIESIDASLTSIDGKITACDIGSVSGTVNVTGATLEDILTAVEKIDDWDSSDKCNITIGDASIADGTYIGDIKFGEGLPANTGVDIGDVTINNAGAGAAVNIQDGGNSITIDGEISIATGETIEVLQDTPTDLKVQIFGDDTTQAIDTDAAGQLQVDVVSDPALSNAGDDILIYGYDYSSANQKVKTDSSGLLYVKSIADSVTVSSSNLDIRDLTSASDSVSAVQSGTWNIGSLTTFPDNEPFNVAQYGGTNVGAGNAVHVQPGTSAVFPVSDNSGSLTVDNSGTFATQATLQASDGTDIGDVDVATLPSTETSTPVEYNVPCTSADTEYSQSFSNAKSIFFQNRDNSDLRYSFTSGRVASSYPYTTLKAGCSYYSDDLDMASGTIYFAHGVGGITVEMVVGQ